MASYRTEEEPVKVTLIRVYLESETPGISDAVCRSSLSHDSREAGKKTGFFAYLAQEISLGEIRDLVSDFKDAIRSGTFGVDKSEEHMKLATIAF